MAACLWHSAATVNSALYILRCIIRNHNRTGRDGTVMGSRNRNLRTEQRSMNCMGEATTHGYCETAAGTRETRVAERGVQ